MTGCKTETGQPAAGVRPATGVRPAAGVQPPRVMRLRRGPGGVIEVAAAETRPAAWRAALATAFGTDEALAEMLLQQIAGAVARPRAGVREGEDDPAAAAALNGALAAIAGLGPRDTAEAMLAAQMVATHATAMEMSRRTLAADGAEAAALANLAAKFMRLYGEQMTRLKRHRGDKQTFRVERVTVQGARR